MKVKLGLLVFLIAALLQMSAYEKDFVPAPNAKAFKDAAISMTKAPNTFSWISDIEHIYFHDKNQKLDGGGFANEILLLADAEKPIYLCGEIIPANTDFELFPYHYYGKKEEDRLGQKINYSMVVKNLSEDPVEVEIYGSGTCTNWNHYEAWEGALKGENKKTLTLKGYETYTLWNEKALKGDLPWAGIFLGKATGDIWVCDYNYISEEDPGVQRAQPMPDACWAPYYFPSFTRGTANWHSAWIDVFKDCRDDKGDIIMSKIQDGAYQFNFAYSPGGPITKPCQYNTQKRTFEEDKLWVVDGVSQQGHLFFGGNYTIMYKFKMPFFNDTGDTKIVNFYLKSNDKYNVDTIAGVWINGELRKAVAPADVKGTAWKVWSFELGTKQPQTMEFTVVPLGSRWGGMIADIEVITKKR